MGNHRYSHPPGAPDDRLGWGMLDIPGALTFTQISGGDVDISGGTDGSDSQDTITVGGTNIMGSAVTWATSDIVFGRAITRDINGTAGRSYWSTFDGTDKVQIWPYNPTPPTASDTSAVTGTSTSYTPTYQNMNTAQAYAAAVRKPSWNYGDDVYPGTAMYQVGFDFAYLPTGGNTSLTSFKGVELIVYPEDQVVYFYIGGEGLIYCPSAVETVIDITGCVDGDVGLFTQAAAATNLAYRIRGY